MHEAGRGKSSSPVPRMSRAPANARTRIDALMQCRSIAHAARKAASRAANGQGFGVFFASAFFLAGTALFAAAFFAPFFSRLPKYSRMGSK